MSKPKRMKPVKARTVKAWCAVESHQTLILWSAARNRGETLRHMTDNGWLPYQYRIARVEIREVTK